MRAISTICWLILAASPCFSQSPQASTEITTMISQPPLLAALDHDNSSPLSLATLFKKIHAAQKLPLPAVAAGPTRASDLSAFNETYAQFASVMSADIHRITTGLGIDWEKEILKTYDPKSAKTEAGKTLRLNGNVARVFNEKWLGSSDGLFILSGVVNRMDRRDFDPAHCGELRFIYRLGYEVRMNGKTYASRMPFTVNMVFSYADDGRKCQDVASLWRIQGVDDDDPAARCPAPAAGAARFFETRFQADGDQRAGGALSFRPGEHGEPQIRRPGDLLDADLCAEGWKISAGETGKYARRAGDLLKDPAKQKQLQDYLSSHMAEIDNGAFRMPENLQADIALSYSTAGSARVANRPFDLVVGKEQAAQLVAAAAKPLKFVQSGAGLLERLNNSSCMGCHQSSSTAGFAFPWRGPVRSRSRCGRGQGRA